MGFLEYVSTSQPVSPGPEQHRAAVLGPLFPAVKRTGRPPVDRRTVVEATAWRFRTEAPWRYLPERFGNQGGDVDWVASIDSTIVRVHQHGATLPRGTGGTNELQEVR